MIYKIIYHANCYDGFTAAWIAHKAFSEMGVAEEKIILIPALYGDSAPEVDQRDFVYILDFSYPRAVLLAIREDAYGLIVLDHHKSAAKELEGIPGCTYDVDRSGAGMTWDHFFNPEPRPHWVDCVEDRDLWKFRYVETPEIHAALTSYPMTLGCWYGINGMHRDVLCIRGKVVKEYLEVYYRKVIPQRRHITVYKTPEDETGIPWTFLNVDYQNCSEIMHLMLEEDSHTDVACTYYMRNTGEWVYSIRSRANGPDVSKIAKSHGGGGHKHAAGFTSWGLLFGL